MGNLHLLAVVEVDPQDSVVCQAPGCGHGIYKRIHIVADTAGALHVFGADCFAKLSGQGARAAAGGLPRYGAIEGRLLDAAERALLAENTARLIELFEAQRQAAAAAQLVAAESARAKRDGAKQQEDAATAAARRSALEREAREFVRAQYGVDPDAPGWVGLVKLRVQALLKRQS